MPFKLYEEGIDVTSKIVIYQTEVKRNGVSVDAVDTSISGTYIITYKVSYGNYNGSISRTVVVEN
jgi:hypothetical protein